MDTHSIRLAIIRDVINVQNIAYRMPPHLKQHKEISQIKILLRLVSKHLNQLEYFERNYQSSHSRTNIDPYISANTRIKNHIFRKGGQVRQLTRNEEMQPYASLALKYLGSILNHMESIQRTMKNVGEIIEPHVESRTCEEQVYQ